MSENTQVAVRDQHGRFVRGVSGNPAGKPVGTRNEITKFRETVEVALRDYLASPTNQVRAMKALDRLFTIVAESEDEKAAVAAGKILLDRILANTKQVDNEDGKGRSAPVLLQIVNHTGERGQRPVQVIEGDFTEVSHEE